MEYRINGAEMADRGSAYDVIAQGLGLPGYFGRNLDALWDMLTGIRGTVTMYNVSCMLNAMGGYGCKMLAVFYEAAEKNEYLSFRAEG